MVKVANLLGPRMWVPAVKSNNFAAGMLNAEIFRFQNGVPVRSSLL